MKMVSDSIHTVNFSVWYDFHSVQIQSTNFYSSGKMSKKSFTFYYWIVNRGDLRRKMMSSLWSTHQARHILYPLSQKHFWTIGASLFCFYSSSLLTYATWLISKSLVELITPIEIRFFLVFCRFLRILFCYFIVSLNVLIFSCFCLRLAPDRFRLHLPRCI